MTELDYHFKDIYGNQTFLRLIQDESLDFWLICDGEITMARISRIYGTWKQLSGEIIPKGLIAGAGTYIEKNYYESIPLRIKQRWPRLITKAEKTSDGEVIVVCTAQVNLISFKPIFCRHVSQLFKEDVKINLKVYSHDFSQDFTYNLDVNGLREKRKLTGILY
ncbi:MULTISPECIES: hypothetical protein [Pedobacter]|uniref:hypothetical protein n=1 Tax=Pedobacter TaxID=84567 RepID=UPI00292D4FAB|nr:MULTISPECIES: hypothetical protein [Pedobacter]